MLLESELDDRYDPDFNRSQTPTESCAEVYEAAELVEEISVYIDCLLDLSPALDNPAFDIQTGGENEGKSEFKVQATELFDVSCEEAFVYCQKIRARFELLPKYISSNVCLRQTSCESPRSARCKRDLTHLKKPPSATTPTVSTHQGATGRPEPHFQ